ncbi:M24 family metallopeptidase [Portibacter marinus]|uniref:M24 family metallopeptidase n=1 Tax=Portibacter marinus TaxID=2898660 RepID=UPI001F2CF854|nr:M24 family metallopeptidase [Portibacter marinus]
MKKIIILLILTSSIWAEAQMPVIFDEKERARIIDEILEERFEKVLPELMRKHDIQMWIVISREYNEDPLLKTMLPSTWLSARRRTILMFYDPGKGQEIEKIAIARYDVGSLLKGSWDKNVNPDQWDALIKIIEDRNPKNIGLNISGDFGLSDGLVYTEYQQFMAALPEQYHQKVISAEPLAISWLETRSDKELEIYPMICRIGHEIINEGLSEKVIHPGLTATEDVVWWLRDRVRELGLDTWFHPTVSLQRADPENFDHLRTFSKRPERQIIEEGDLLHVDFGITYLRLSTDQQQHFYVLKKNEKQVPQFLVQAFDRSNRLQDILTSNFKEGRTGNEILELSLEQAKKEGLNASIYTHPIGLHGHAAGPTIGMWDQQQGVPGRGDYPLYNNTAYSIELNTSTEIPEWNKVIRIMLEEDGYFSDGAFYYIDGRQKEIQTIPRKPSQY